MKSTLGKVWDGALKFLDPPALHQWSAVSAGIGGAKSVLDLGCGKGGHIKETDRFSGIQLVGVDVSRTWASEVPGCYSEVIEGQLLDVLASTPADAYDVVMAIDVVEHFDRSDGYKLLSEMRRVSARSAIVATPNGFVPQPPSDDNPFNEHRSGWTADDLKAAGFREVSGHFGHRRLRGSFGLPTVRPSHLGYLLSALTARPLAPFPSVCYQLVGIAHKVR